MDTQLEYLTLKRNALQLEDAVQSDLVTITGKLRSKGLISEKIEARLKDESRNAKDRAAKLVTIVTNVVKLKPEQYNMFVEVLQEGGIDVIRPQIMTQDNPQSMVCKIQTSQQKGLIKIMQIISGSYGLIKSRTLSFGKRKLILYYNRLYIIIQSQ